MSRRCCVCGKGLTHVRAEARVKVEGLGFAHPECEDKPLPKPRPPAERPDDQGGLSDRRRALKDGSLTWRPS